MSVSDMFKFSSDKSGARAFARLDSGARTHGAAPKIARRPAEATEPVATVTLDKIGDFLELDFRRLFVWVRAGLAVAVMLAAAGAVAGGAYALLSKPKYTVEADVLIDPSNLQVVANGLYSEPGQVDGQMLNAGSMLRVMTSGSVLSRVVDELDLVDDREFYDPAPSFSFSQLLGGSRNTAKSDPHLAALGNLARRVSTSSDDKSFVATLAVSSESPDKAVHISNAIIEAFKDELAKAEADGASRAAAALNDRLDTLRQDVKDAEEKVEAYKRDHGLVSSDGQLVSTQMMTQLNSQVAEAQSRVVAAQSNYDAVVAAGRNATTSDTVASTALAALRDKASDLSQQLNSQSMVLGPRHPTIVSLQAQLATVDAQIKTEVGRIVATAKASLDEANATLAGLRAKTDGLKNSVFSDNESQVALRELERDATSKAAIYETFLARARQITEQEQIDTTNVRVISTAVPPAGRSWPPPTTLMLVAGAFGGFLLGLVLAVGMGILGDLRQPPGHEDNPGTFA